MATPGGEAKGAGVASAADVGTLTTHPRVTICAPSTAPVDPVATGRAGASRGQGMTKDTPIKQLDRRVVDRYLQRGIVTDKVFQQYLKDLPDLDGKYEVVTVAESLEEAREETKPN